MEIPWRGHLRETCLTLWSALHRYESALVPWARGQNNRLWQSLMSISKVLVALTPACRGLPSSPQRSFLAVELCHIPGEVRLFSCMGLCSLDLLPEVTHSLLCVYNDPWGEMSLRVSLSARTEST